MARCARPSRRCWPCCAQIDAITVNEVEALARYARPAITNTRGEAVGVIQARFES